MPNWQPNWEDVAFDHAAAQAAIDECLAAAGALDTGFGGVATANAALTTDGAWVGAYQVEYDGARATLSGDASVLAAELRRVAGSIQTARGAATTEQTQRENDRERWRTEKAAEDAARAQNPRGRNIPI
jgi:hypothetical protein